MYCTQTLGMHVNNARVFGGTRRSVMLNMPGNGLSGGKGGGRNLYVRADRPTARPGNAIISLDLLEILVSSLHFFFKSLSNFK